MKDSVALQRYLQRHIEPDLPAAPCDTPQWQDVLVLPAYRESPALLEKLRELPAGSGRNLVILVLNRPDNDPDPKVNELLRQSLADLDPVDGHRGIPPIRGLNGHTDLYLHDMEAQGCPLPAAQGVGLARKAGCDIALTWMAAGAISGDWIYSTDADAAVPPDYFTRLQSHPGAVAAVFPFLHVPGTDRQCNDSTALYELRLHHYVLGLQFAGSPYAYHSLGSCLAVRADAYAKVRGFPKRSGGEDFYLLNKLAKLGPIVPLEGACIQLQSRYSARVPFGTGPAVEKISDAGELDEQTLFYHPHCFEALRTLLHTVAELTEAVDLQPLLCERGLAAPLASASARVLDGMGLPAALQHCRRQGKSREQFLRQFHQWFDAFRTLKFIHALREAGWQDQSLQSLHQLEPTLWPGNRHVLEKSELRDVLLNHWHWTYW